MKSCARDFACFCCARSQSVYEAGVVLACSERLTQGEFNSVSGAEIVVSKCYSVLKV